MSEYLVCQSARVVVVGYDALCAQGGNKPVLEICENPYFHVYLSIKTYIETECKRPHGIISSSLGYMAQ